MKSKFYSFFYCKLIKNIYYPYVFSLSNWLDDMERQIGMLAMPALRPDQIAQQQDKNEV